MRSGGRGVGGREEILIEHLNLSGVFTSIFSSNPHTDVVRRGYCYASGTGKAVGV